MMKYLLLTLGSLSLEVGIGTSLLCVIQEGDRHSAAVAGVIISRDIGFSELERAQYACLATAANEGYAPAVVNFAMLLNCPLRSNEASRQLIYRAISIIMNER